MTTLITGAARSGKTRHALTYRTSTETGVYIATAELLDEEMRAKAARHRAERGDTWRTIEEPRQVADCLKSLKGLVVVDCLTLFLSNWLLEGEDQINGQIEKLCSSLRQTEAHVIAITNEVGWSIVPENALARAFRDYSGLMNQRVAEIADRVILMVAGIPIRVK